MKRNAAIQRRAMHPHCVLLEGLALDEELAELELDPEPLGAELEELPRPLLELLIELLGQSSFWDQFALHSPFGSKHVTVPRIRAPQGQLFEFAMLTSNWPF